MPTLTARIEAAWLAVIPLAAAAAYVATGGAHAGWLYLLGWIPLAVSTAVQPRAVLSGHIAPRGRVSALISTVTVGLRNADAPHFLSRFLVEQAVLDVGCLMLAFAGMLAAKNLTDRSLGVLPAFVAALLVAAGAAMWVPVLDAGGGLDASFGLAFLTAVGAKATLIDALREGNTARPPAAARADNAAPAPSSGMEPEAVYILVGLGLWMFGLPLIAALFHPDGLCAVGNCSSS
ncbi:MAG: hypothetical protein RLZZ383_1639 [Pseudomonadota bacterium]